MKRTFGNYARSFVENLNVRGAYRSAAAVCLAIGLGLAAGAYIKNGEAGKPRTRLEQVERVVKDLIDYGVGQPVFVSGERGHQQISQSIDHRAYLLLDGRIAEVVKDRQEPEVDFYDLSEDGKVKSVKHVRSEAVFEQEGVFVVLPDGRRVKTVAVKKPFSGLRLYACGNPHGYLHESYDPKHPYFWDRNVDGEIDRNECPPDMDQKEADGEYGNFLGQVNDAIDQRLVYRQKIEEIRRDVIRTGSVSRSHREPIFPNIPLLAFLQRTVPDEMKKQYDTDKGKITVTQNLDFNKDEISFLSKSWGTMCPIELTSFPQESVIDERLDIGCPDHAGDFCGTVAVTGMDSDVVKRTKFMRDVIDDLIEQIED